MGIMIDPAPGVPVATLMSILRDVAVYWRGRKSNYERGEALSEFACGANARLARIEG
jgi:hypothetical protein